MTDKKLISLEQRMLVQISRDFKLPIPVPRIDAHVLCAKYLDLIEEWAIFIDDLDGLSDNEIKAVLSDNISRRVRYAVEISRCYAFRDNLDVALRIVLSTLTDNAVAADTYAAEIVLIVSSYQSTHDESIFYT